jgi:hypothetical protein
MSTTSTPYDFVHDLAIETDQPTAVVPVLDAGEPILWFASFTGPRDWLELSRQNPELSAIATCVAAHESSQRAGYAPALP